jgi:hypothetical protein
VLLLVLGSVERNDAAATGPSVKPEAKVSSLLTEQKGPCLLPFVSGVALGFWILLEYL